MKTLVVATLVGMALAAGSARAEDAALTAAQEKVREVRDALKAAPSGYDGHKARAVNHLDQALAELRDAQKVDTKKDATTEHKADKLEKRVDQMKGKVN